jgi:hypothetical protein
MEKKSWDEIEVSLRTDVDAKRAAYFAARKDLDTAFTPSGIPHPDGTLNIKNAGASHTYAIQAYRMALAEHHDFYLRGVIPNRFILVGPSHGKNW